MSIVEHDDGSMTLTGDDIAMYAILAAKHLLHLDLTLKAFGLNMYSQKARTLRARYGLSTRGKNAREKAYREFCDIFKLDPSCRYSEHDHVTKL